MRERITGVDTAWLRMDVPTNLMMIVGVMMMDGQVRARDVKRLVKARWLGFRRFRQKAVVDATGAWWVDDEAFDIDWHVPEIDLPGEAGKRELEALVSDLASTPLDFDRPLWQFHVVRNYAGRTAIIQRIHHCYADGIALIQVLLSLTHTTAAGSLQLPAQEAVAADAADPGDFWMQVFKPVTRAFDGASQIGRDLLEQGRDLAANPTQAAGAVQEATKKGVDFAGDLAKILLMTRDSETRFKGALGTRKVVAWAEPLPLDEVKAVGKALGCSINDVLLAMAAGALRDYLVDQGDTVDPGLEIRALVPVNLRATSEALALGNNFGLVFLELPIGMAHPLERVYEVRSRMRRLKGSYQPLIALGILGAVGYGPKVLQEQVTQILAANASAVMTNVPGPQHPLYFAGKRIAELDFWVPQAGGIGMGVSILSYDGRIQFGVITDAGLVPDPGEIVSRFADEFEQLLWITLMSPWGEDVADAALAAPAAEKTPAAPPPRRRKARPKAAGPKIPRRFRNL